MIRTVSFRTEVNIGDYTYSVTIDPLRYQLANEPLKQLMPFLYFCIIFTYISAKQGTFPQKATFPTVTTRSGGAFLISVIITSPASITKQ